MAFTTTNIRRALNTLGVYGRASLRYISADRICVMLNDDYFGIWDCEKNTFVD